MSVTGNFFCKLRSFAITLEKEAAHLEQAFNQEESEYEDESPMRVLHDLRSEIIGLKTDIQGTIAKNHVKVDELNAFLKICRVLQTRNSSDIHRIKDTFQKYGYNPPDNDTSENEVFSENPKPDVTDESNHNTVSADPPTAHLAMDKPTIFDLRAPQLSDFGLSHYQLPLVWEPQNDKLHVKIPEEKPKPSYKDIRTINVAKTPKCSLTREEDFSQIEHFGISDYSNNLNDDYTIALINKKKGSVTGNSTKENSHNLKSMLAIPAHLKYRNDFCSVDSPLPPVFCTPGLKVHKKTTEKETCESNHSESESRGSDSSEECTSSKAVLPFQALSRDIGNVSSPQPPMFCTPGLKVQKKEMSCVVVKSVEDKEANVAENLDTPPIPSFETRWMKTDTLARTLDITEPIPRPEMSHTAYLDQAAPMGLNTDQYGNPATTTSPPKMSDFTIGTPPRPEMTSCLTQDVFKYSMKAASPPKVSEYENLLWTPTRPEMTSCITEDISQLLSQYCDNKTKPSWQDPQGLYTRNAETENKENRP